MMVRCQTHSVRLRIVAEDKSVTILHFASRKERDGAKAFYASHGFTVK